MIETAMEVTDGAVSIRVIREILAAGREMLTSPSSPCPASTRLCRSCPSAIVWC
jgi:putative hydrolase of the HAD superfamily